ncbi:amidohydrolase [Hirsutella rhossiliensis]|uniref:Amidohydrolase domain-containing protein n=1 Tax=Hirsutella rhossiliensis TaxID=111463 RepID=A0A9P8MQN3_9HYPO|nr:amidohydrolase domain-containing protein [Hirsutella rhossiliensis]KAH0959515.1 amidohydrolase domain-containing protein [Hirsutella rhossiliensis]
MAEDQLILPIIDAHIHLYPGDEVDSLAWCGPDHDLAGQHSLDQYRRATASAPSLLGFVVVEADRKHDLAAGAADGSGWEQPLAEVRWMRRVALGQPRDGQGHQPRDADLCLAMIPWAPLPSGPAVLERYLDKAREAAGDAWPKVKGFRYLLQDKPHGTMLHQDFIDGLKLLGRRRFVFEVAVDQRRRGKKQLDEVIEMVDRAHDGVPEEDKVTFILDHLCKPDLAVYNVTSDPSFSAWRTAMYALSKASRTYVKLSGALAEMSDRLRAQPAPLIFQSTVAWLGVVLATFGPSRILFGSDWPVCSAAGLGDDAWPKWRDVVEKMCWMATLDDDDRAMIFGGAAKQAYGL